MALIKQVLGKTPEVGENTFLAETATLIGDVSIGKDSSIWYNAILRGDVNPIEIGDETNVQDNVTIHCTHNKTTTKIGNRVTIGHNAVLHGCEIGDNVLIGMGAIVMDYCKIGSDSVIAAGAVVTKGSMVKAGEIWGGIPARKIKSVAIDALHEGIRAAAENYLKYKEWYEG